MEFDDDHQRWERVKKAFPNFGFGSPTPTTTIPATQPAPPPLPEPPSPYAAEKQRYLICSGMCVVVILLMIWYINARDTQGIFFGPRNIPGQQRASAPPPTYTPASNVNALCPGEVIERGLGFGEVYYFNLSSCAYSYVVLEGRLLFGSNSIGSHTIEVGPLGTKEPLGMRQWVQSAPNWISRFQYMLCVRQTPAMLEWRCN